MGKVFLAVQIFFVVLMKILVFILLFRGLI